MPQIIAGGDIGTDQIGFPTVIKVAGRLAAPIDDWYLWAAPHDNPGGIYLFTAPAPEGPWTVANSGDPVLATPAPYRHVSSPYVLWLDGELVMFCHMLEADPSIKQPSFRATSPDGLTWDLNLTPIIPEATGSDLDTVNQSYLNVAPYRGRLFGYYQGSAEGGARIFEVTSSDGGVTWTKTRQESNGSAFAPRPGETFGKPHPVVMNDHLFVFYTSRYAAETGGRNKYRKRRPDGSFPVEWMHGLQTRPGQWDSWKIEFGDMVWDGTKFWLFYSATASTTGNVGDAVGVASCTFPQSGFDTSFGKG